MGKHEQASFIVIRRIKIGLKLAEPMVEGIKRTDDHNIIA